MHVARVFNIPSAWEKNQELCVPTGWLLLCKSENQASCNSSVTLGKILADRFYQSINHLPPLELVEIKCHKSVCYISPAVKWEQSFLSQRSTSKDEVFWQDSNRKRVSILTRNRKFSLTDAMLMCWINVVFRVVLVLFWVLFFFFSLFFFLNIQVYEPNENQAWVIFLMCWININQHMHF